jgi:alkylation response protein AidB-like acyl-CoA dehydrogenase
MDFSLSTDHEILRDSVRSFAEKEIKPVAAELDEKEELRAGYGLPVLYHCC